MISLLKNKRFILVLMLTTLVAAYFWSSSRYPALNEKAMMGANTHIEAIGFDIFFTIPQGASTIKRILYNSLNWMYTNRKGMTFGVIFGALLMTLLPFLQQLQFRSRFANSVMGVVMGAPLGLCVNCSTPVAQGIYFASGRAETMLAAMVSSPTLNIIVLTMLFSLFPFYLATIKLSLTIGFVLIGVPLLTRFLFPNEHSVNSVTNIKLFSKEINKRLSNEHCKTEEECKEENNENWINAFIWLLKTGFKNLWYVVKITVPLMILAGFLGAAVVTILPFETLIPYLPNGRISGLLGMLFIALFGLFLPVPMAFDVIVTAILLNAGMPVKYAAVLLFTLGIFSVYPFSMIWKTVSWKMAVSVFVVLTTLGVVAGGIASRYYQWDYARQENFIFENFTKSGRPFQTTQIDRTKQGTNQDELLASLQSHALKPETVWQENNFILSKIPYSAKNGSGEKMFTRLDSKAFGITEHNNYTLLKLDFRYAVSRGISSGDFNNDGWQDIVISSDAGFGVYANNQGRGFVQMRVEIPELNDHFISNVVLVDMNNDGWLDLYFSSLREGNFLIYNKQGHFTKENMVSLPNHADAIMTSSPAFGDVDRDGDLDIVLGNVSINKLSMNASFNSSRNVWLKQNSNQQFEIMPLDGINGETLTTLLSDINGDGWLDLIVGNDIEQPDYYYLGNANGGFRLVTKSDNLVPYSTLTSMNVTSADIDNDLKPEIYVGQIARREKLGMKGHARSLSPQEQCAEISEKDARLRCEDFYNFSQITQHAQTPGSVFECAALPTQTERDTCIAYKVLWHSQVKNDENYCNMIPANWDYLSYTCHQHFAPVTEPKIEELSQAIPQKNAINMLFRQNDSGNFDDKAKDFGLQLGGWTWNAKFADLNNDGWQDIYIANGYIMSTMSESNYLYMNREGKNFEDYTEKAGMTSLLDTLSYTYIDIDNDGDLDIISVPTVGPISVYINNSNSGNAVSFELHDEKGNRYGIGSKIFIYYGANEKQMREIQASGGYQSFDSPIAHFGLGNEQTIKRIEIEWSTGEKSVIEKEFTSGARYIITKQK